MAVPAAGCCCRRRRRTAGSSRTSGWTRPRPPNERISWWFPPLGSRPDVPAAETRIAPIRSQAGGGGRLPASRSSSRHLGARPYPSGGRRGADGAHEPLPIRDCGGRAVRRHRGRGRHRHRVWISLGPHLLELNDLLVMSNATIGLTLSVAGLPIAARRPRNPIGWLLLGGGISYASTAAGITALACVPAASRADPLWRLLG